MTTDYLTEEQWNDINSKIYEAVLKVFLKNNLTVEEAIKTTEKIKYVFVKSFQPEEQAL